jgi:hypothetical protein
MKTKVEANKFHESFNLKNANSSSIHLAYYGASYALLAKYADEPKDKKERFTLAVQHIEKAVKDLPNNFEIRLIRLSVQENSPKIVKYKSNIAEDKALIIKEFSKQDKELQTCLKNYLKDSKCFTPEEKMKLK